MRCETVAQTQELLNQMNNEILQFKEELLRLTWHMRGGVTYNEIFHFSAKERDIISKIVKENLETTKKTGLPYF